jgi:hypothetical protein
MSITNPSYYRLVENVVMGRAANHVPYVSRTRLSSLGKVKTFFSKFTSGALTMCGEKSIGFLNEAMTIVLAERIPGDFIEAGVWRGGIPILMRAFLHENQDNERIVFVADSFSGLPTTGLRDPRDRLASALMRPFSQLAVSQDQVEQSFKYFGLLDRQVRFLPGWFSETLPLLPESQKFSVIRLDGDYFESTMDALVSLYPKLSTGGYLIIDDYGLPLGCRKAVDDYRGQNNIQAPLTWINGQSVYWRKPESIQ